MAGLGKSWQVWGKSWQVGEKVGRFRKKVGRLGKKLAGLRTLLAVWKKRRQIEEKAARLGATFEIRSSQDHKRFQIMKVRSW